MTGRRLPGVRPALATAVAIGAFVVALPGTAAGASTSPRVDVLAFEPTASPVLRALRNRLGRRMNVQRATPSRLRRPRRYEALLVDGDSSSPGELRRRARTIRRFVDAGASLVAVDVTSAHYRRALDDLTGARALPAGGSHASRVALLRRVVSDGVPRTSVIDARRLQPWGAGRLSIPDRRASRRAEARRLAAMVGRELRAVRHPPRAAFGQALAAAAQATSALPPELQHASWSFTFPGASVTPRAQLANADSQQSRTIANFPSPIYVPRFHGQTATWTTTHTFDVYLANGDTPGGDGQVVVYGVDGTFSPKGPADFIVMDLPFEWKGFFGQPQSFNLERAWWTGMLDASVAPDAAASGRLTWQSSQPPVADATERYSAGESFSISYRLSRPKGPGDAVTLGVNGSQNYDMPDWGVANETTGSSAKWQFSARTNCDVRPAGYSDAGCFDLGASSSKVPNRPNGLSLGSLAFHASARWQSKSLLADSNSGTLTFTTSFAPTLADTHCSGWGIAACSGYELERFAPPADVHSVQIDASTVLPVGVRSVTFDTAHADGSSLERLKGTVTLDAPARLPGGTNVVVYSDSRNAVVGDLVGTGPQSRTTVVVPQGQTTATFDVGTNDIALRAGTTAKAAVNAFYAGSHLAPLEVGATARPAGQKPDRLYPNERLEIGDQLVSADGRYVLVLQDDGNLVLYPAGSSSALWASGTHGRGVASAVMQDDGNFVLYRDDGQPVWATGTNSGQPGILRLENDGKVHVYSLSLKPQWARPE